MGQDGYWRSTAMPVRAELLAAVIRTRRLLCYPKDFTDTNIGQAMLGVARLCFSFFEVRARTDMDDGSRSTLSILGTDMFTNKRRCGLCG